VESHEDLDALMARFPFAPFSRTETLTLRDILPRAFEGCDADDPAGNGETRPRGT
jgi:hypothetical protein